MMTTTTTKISPVKETKIYNAQTGFPFQVRLPLAITLHPTKHAIQAAQTDRYGRIEIPEYISTEGVQLVEIEMKDDRIMKVVLRKSYSAEFDVVFVVVDHGILLTCWLNCKSDTHRTLNKSRIAQVA